jgi:mannose-6-phosphate isomerase-like protein (cupin superfamily)
MGQEVRVLADTASTGGAFGVIEVSSGAGEVPPMHVHEREDEAFYVLEGDLTFFIGDERIDAGAGDFVLGRRLVPHGYLVRSPKERHLSVVVPGGFEGFFEEAARTGTGEEDPPDLQRLEALSLVYGVALLGPPPE